MILAVFPLKDGIELEMSSSLQSKLQDEVDYVCKNLYQKCLLYDPNIPNPDFPQEWLLNIFINLLIFMNVARASKIITFLIDNRFYWHNKTEILRGNNVH